MIINANSIAQYKLEIKNGIIKHVNVNRKLSLVQKRLLKEAHAFVFVRKRNI